MVAWSAVTFQRLAPRPADCKTPFLRPDRRVTDWALSFAFVEYESRRDADDAYHEMHNKRIGRDDVLKIEV